MEKKNTGLTDDYGTPIKDGDTIEWTFYRHGIMFQEEDGTESFIAGLSGGNMIKKEFKEKRKIEYEVRGETAGYFLDRPGGMAHTYIKEEPKCKVVD